MCSFLQALLAEGAEINARNERGETVWTLVQMYGNWRASYALTNSDEYLKCESSTVFFGRIITLTSEYFQLVFRPYCMKYENLSVSLDLDIFLRIINPTIIAHSHSLL